MYILLNDTKYEVLSVNGDSTSLVIKIPTQDNMNKVIMDVQNHKDSIVVMDEEKVVKEYVGYSEMVDIKYTVSDIAITFKQEYNDSKSLNIIVGERVTVNEAYQYRKDIETIANYTPDEEAKKYIWTYSQWESDVDYLVGDKAIFHEVLYKCLQAHKSQDTWNPEEAPSLWVKVINEDPSGDIPVWEQPSSENPYMKGDKVHFPTIDDAVYESLIDNNVWSPEVYPNGWKEIE